jgi:hypothetical protein
MISTYDHRLHGPVRQRARHLPPLVKTIVVIIALVVVGSFLKSLFSPRAPAKCVYGCGPTVGPNVPGRLTFTSAEFGFSFGYPGFWETSTTAGNTVADLLVKDSNGSLLSDFQVAAGTGNREPGQLIQSRAQSLGQSIQQLESTGGMPGAQIGYSPGQGEFFRGSLVYSVGSVQPVQVSILAVQRSNEWVVVTAVSAYNSQKQPVAGPTFDDTLIRWTWMS